MLAARGTPSATEATDQARSFLAIPGMEGTTTEEALVTSFLGGGAQNMVVFRTNEGRFFRVPESQGKKSEAAGEGKIVSRRRS